MLPFQQLDSPAEIWPIGEWSFLAEFDAAKTGGWSTLASIGLLRRLLACSPVSLGGASNLTEDNPQGLGRRGVSGMRGISGTGSEPGAIRTPRTFGERVPAVS